MMMENSIQQQARKALVQLPPEGLEELAQYIEFLLFKYRLTNSSDSAAAESISSDMPADSLTARFRGFIQSPLTVAELSEAYELDLLDHDE
jgi:hypothetical protein